MVRHATLHLPQELGFTDESNDTLIEDNFEPMPKSPSPKPQNPIPVTQLAAETTEP